MALAPRYALRPHLPLPIWWLYRGLRTFLVSTAFAGFWFFGVVLAWLVLPLVALFAGAERRRACQRLVAWSFRVFHGYMSLLRLLKVRLDGALPRELAGSPVVFVANHTTLVDVTAIFSNVPDLCCVAKTSIASSRSIGRLIALCGFIDAGASVAERAASVDACVRRLEDGFSVLVFPEGTRSPEGSMNAFQRGAFEVACRANVPVVPLVLRCDPSALRRGQRFWAQPDTCARLSILVGDPFSPTDFAAKSRPMRSAIEAYYRRRLGLDAAAEADTTGTGESEVS